MGKVKGLNKINVKMWIMEAGTKLIFVTVYTFENVQRRREKRDAKPSTKLYFRMYLMLKFVKW